jgi:hypothetical protein
MSNILIKFLPFLFLGAGAFMGISIFAVGLLMLSSDRAGDGFLTCLTGTATTSIAIGIILVFLSPKQIDIGA